MKRLLTLHGLSTKLGNRSRSAIYNDLSEKRLPPPIKLGGRLYWEDDVVDAHLAAMRDRAA